MKCAVVITGSFIVVLGCGSISASHQVKLQDEPESKTKMLQEWSEKDVRDSGVLWRLYSEVSRCYHKKDKLCDKLTKHIRHAIDDNKNILCLPRSITGENLESSKDLYPLVAFAQFVSGASTWWCGSDRVEGYSSIFWNIFDLDTDNGRRIQALRLFVKSNHTELVRKLLEKEVDITQDPEPAKDLVLCCYGKQSEIQPTQWCTFFQRMIKSVGGSRVDESPEEQPGFFKRPLSAQLISMDIARLLVGAHANLSGIHEKFLPSTHRDECLSCLSLYNKALDVRT